MSDCRFGVSPVNYPDPDPEDKKNNRNQNGVDVSALPCILCVQYFFSYRF